LPPPPHPRWSPLEPQAQLALSSWSTSPCSTTKEFTLVVNAALLVEHFRREINQRSDFGLEIAGISRDAMAILESDDWPGNVRELEAVVKRAMISRRRGWVTPGDIVMPRLRRDGLADAMRRSPGIHLTRVQEEALQLKSTRGEVRRTDLVARCRVSHEVTRRALAGLAGLGLLRRVGLGRATRCVSRSFWHTFLDDAAEMVLSLVR
jgi:hypothetical protein